jgi:hypothetical protein
VEVAPGLTCHRLRIRDGKLEELRDDGPVVSLPLHELVEARVVRTQTAERPIIQGVLGLGVTALGVVWAFRIVLWLRHGGTLVDLEVLMLAWLVVGPIILAGAVRRGVVLRARTRRTVRKLIVGKDVTVAELQRFAERAQAEHGIPIAIDLPPPRR